MANRTPGAMPALTTEDVLAALLRKVAALETRVAQLEAQDGLILPGDYRFQTGGTGGDELVVRRVSTGSTATIAGPM